MARAVDIAGQQFGRLTVQARAHGSRWLCICECGNQKEVPGGDLKEGKVRSCGCLRSELVSLRHRKNLAGRRFGRLLAVEYDHSDARGRAFWKCDCDCGEAAITSGKDMLQGKIESCGCLRREVTAAQKKTHGESRTLLYRVWRAMIRRCDRPNDADWKSYGGRGITVCSRWRNDFAAWRDDMGPKPTPKHSIDRRDNDGGYWCGKCPECIARGRPFNCRWATQTEQMQNTRRNRRHVA
jgi:hypothetical protein